MPDPPIQNLDSMDIIGRRHDGGIDCVITALKLDDSPEHERLLEQKIKNYVDAIMSDDFQQQFGPFSQTNTRIIISCTERPYEKIVELIGNIAIELKEYGIALDWMVEPIEDGEDFGGEYHDDVSRSLVEYSIEPTGNLSFPLWAVYIVAPILVLLFCIPILITTESPVIIGGFAIGCGLLCAVVMHLYVWIKSKIKGK